MAAQSKVIAHQVDESALETDDRWSPVHMMMFCTVVSALLWGGLFTAFRWIIG